jgi:hypothetical protein
VPDISLYDHSRTTAALAAALIAGGHDAATLGRWVRQPETDAELAVALDVRLDDDLIAEGLARDVVNRVQLARRSAGLDVSDRIRLRWWTPDGRLADAIAGHAAYIAAETLSAEMTRSDGPVGEPVEVEGRELRVQVEPLG